jgi:hypothetical protein
MGRIILAGIAGGIAMFVMMSIAHMSLVAQVGFSQMTNDKAALSALQAATANKPGLYIYPTVDMRSKDAMSKAEAVRKVMPSGILIYQPPGVPGMTPRLLGTEFATEVVQALLAALLLSFAMIATYWGRVGFVVLVGFASAISTNISYWNWYSFPGSYTLANMGIEIASFIAAAFVIAALVKPKAA